MSPTLIACFIVIHLVCSTKLTLPDMEKYESHISAKFHFTDAKIRKYIVNYDHYKNYITNMNNSGNNS
ncbi:MAG: hypothetical protein D3917_06845 [Candidatus Electrothrix sp. AX5]|nr:hypothetical protein [Candidatus Electrothrix sp. AX5]